MLLFITGTGKTSRKRIFRTAEETGGGGILL
jgi:hypothetical protein